MATITFQGNPVQTCGDLPAIGQTAPKFGGVNSNLETIRLPELFGKKIVINFFPSIDTSVCAASVRKFNEMAASLDNTVVLCVSKDLPFAQSRFCGAESIKNVMTLSAFRCQHFDENYGLTMADGPLKGLLARAVFVIDTEGKLVYEQLVPEVTNEPDYDAVLKVLQSL